MSRRSQSSHHLPWVVLLLAILAAFSFHTGSCGPPAHQAESARAVVVVDTDDDPWDDPAVDDDVHGSPVVVALGRAARRPENARLLPEQVSARRPAHGTGPDVAVRQVAAPAGAALLTRLGVSLT